MDNKRQQLYENMKLEDDNFEEEFKEWLNTFTKEELIRFRSKSGLLHHFKRMVNSAEVRGRVAVGITSIRCYWFRG